MDIEQPVSHTQGQTFKVYSKPSFLGYRDIEYSIFASDSAANTCQILLEGFRRTAITGLETSPSANIAPATFCFDINWKPDVHLLEKEDLSADCASTRNISLHQQDQKSSILPVSCIFLIGWNKTRLKK